MGDTRLEPLVLSEAERRTLENWAKRRKTDPLHLALVFNIDHTNAMAYAGAARNLLAGPAGPALSPHRPA
jgi:hypothetical protein